MCEECGFEEEGFHDCMATLLHVQREFEIDRVLSSLEMENANEP